MADRGTQFMLDDPSFSVMTGAPDAALRWYAIGPAPEAMLLPRHAPRPFGLDDDEPGPEEQA